MGKTRTLLTPQGSFPGYEKERPSAQWQSEVWHGPYLPHPTDCLKRAFLKQGLPARLCCDNGVVASSLLPELRTRPAKNLEELTSIFSAELEQGYHNPLLFSDSNAVW